MATISIIMPTYNVESYLKEAVDCVINQTYDDWELVIVDDGSTDRSGIIADQLAKQDDRIMVIHKSNGGLSDARNVGLDNASGKYIHFFDSDDTIENDFYEQLLANALSTDADIVVSGYSKDVISSGVVTTKYDLNEITIPLQSVKKCRLFLNYINYAWNKLFRRTFLKEHFLHFEKGLSIIEDQVFMQAAIKFEPLVSFISYSGYHYKIRKRQTLGNNSFNDSMLACELRSIEIKFDIVSYFCKDNDVLHMMKPVIALSNFKWLMHCMFTYGKMSYPDSIKVIKNFVHNDTVRHCMSIKAFSIYQDKIIALMIQMRFTLGLYLLYKFAK